MAIGTPAQNVLFSTVRLDVETAGPAEERDDREAPLHAACLFDEPPGDEGAVREGRAADVEEVLTALRAEVEPLGGADHAFREVLALDREAGNVLYLHYSTVTSFSLRRQAARRR